MSPGPDRCNHSFPDPYPQPMTQPGDCRACGISYQEARAAMTAADELRAASARLRTLIAAVAEDMAANPYWASAEHPPHVHPSPYARGVDNGLGGLAGAFAAAMDPTVGALLADWLDSWDGADIDEHAAMPDDLRHALLIARALNGGRP